MRGPEGFRPTRLLVAGVALALASGLYACERALLVDPSAPSTGAVSLSYTFAQSDRSESVFEQVDRAQIELSRNGLTVMDTILDMDPGGNPPRVGFDLEVSGGEETFDAHLALASSAGHLFRGEASFSVRPGRTTTVGLVLSPVVAGVQVPGSIPVIEALNDTVQLTGSAVFVTGDPIAGVVLTWSSMDPTVVEVSPEGRLVSRSEGEADVIAEVEDHSGRLTARVHPAVHSVSVVPSSVTLELGETTGLEVLVLDPRDNPLADRVVEWSSADPSIASVTPDGEVTALSGGTTVIFAVSQGVEGSTSVTVLRPEVRTLRISPTDPELVVGEAAQLSATAYDDAGAPIHGVRAIWSTSDPGVAEVSDDGLVTGVAAGATTIRARADDAVDEVTVTVVPDRDRDPWILTGSLSDATLGLEYQEVISTAGGVLPYTWAIIDGRLPMGLSLDTATGRIRGTPMEVETAIFTIRVTDGDGRSDTRELRIRVMDEGGPVLGAPVVTTPTLPNGAVGQDYSAQLGAAGGEVPYGWSVVGGALPAGLALDPSTGRISGTPTAADTGNFTVRVTGADGLSNTRRLQITVVAEGEPPLALRIQTEALPDGEEGEGYSVQLGATGGQLPYSWAVTGGALPTGLSLDGESGQITGTTTEPGTAPFTVQVTDHTGASDARELGITVTEEDDPIGPVDDPEITTESLPAAVVGTAYTAQLEAADGTPPYTWSLTSGVLPAGLSLDPATGEITGTPTTVGTAAFTIRLTDDAGGSDARELGITVTGDDDPIGPVDDLAITTDSLPDASVGTAYTAQLEADDGTPPYTWSLAEGALPDGLSLDPATGEITGTPAKTGTSTFTIRVTDDAGDSDAREFTITVGSGGGTGPKGPGG